MKYKIVNTLCGQFVGESEPFDTKEEAEEIMGWLLEASVGGFKYSIDEVEESNG